MAHKYHRRAHLGMIHFREGPDSTEITCVHTHPAQLSPTSLQRSTSPSLYYPTPSWLLRKSGLAALPPKYFVSFSSGTWRCKPCRRCTTHLQTLHIGRVSCICFIIHAVFTPLMSKKEILTKYTDVRRLKPILCFFFPGPTALASVFATQPIRHFVVMA